MSEQPKVQLKHEEGNDGSPVVNIWQGNTLLHQVGEPVIGPLQMDVAKAWCLENGYDWEAE